MVLDVLDDLDGVLALFECAQTVLVIGDHPRDLAQLATHLGVTGGGTSPLELLREISGLPAELEVSLEELRIERNSIKARGVTQDFRTVDRVKEELSKVPQFKEVTAGNVQNRQRAAGVTFDLTIDLRGAQP